MRVRTGSRISLYLLVFTLTTFGTMPLAFGQATSVDQQITTIKTSIDKAKAAVQALLTSLKNTEAEAAKIGSEYDGIIKNIKDLCDSVAEGSDLSKEIDRVYTYYKDMHAEATRNKETEADKAHWELKIQETQKLLEEINGQKTDIIKKGRLLAQNVVLLDQNKKKAMFEVRLAIGKRNTEEMKGLGDDLGNILSELDQFRSSIKFEVRAAH